MNFRHVNIASNEDMMETKEEWEEYFDNKRDFKPYENMLSKLNIIVGFGRGFWAGVHGYSYLVYHAEKEAFYWYLRDIESDDVVHFYEINDDAPIFALLKEKSIKEHFTEYDEALDYGLFYSLSRGNMEELPHNMKHISLEELFGEDTEALRIALMSYKPATLGSKYPHIEYHKQYFLPFEKDSLDELAAEYNAGDHHVFIKNDRLYIRLNDDEYELKKNR